MFLILQTTFWNVISYFSQKIWTVPCVASQSIYFGMISKIRQMYRLLIYSGSFKGRYLCHYCIPCYCSTARKRYITFHPYLSRCNWNRLRQSQQGLVLWITRRRPDSHRHSNILRLWETYQRLPDSHSGLLCHRNSSHGCNRRWNYLGLHAPVDTEVLAVLLPVGWLSPAHRSACRIVHLFVLPANLHCLWVQFLGCHWNSIHHYNSTWNSSDNIADSIHSWWTVSLRGEWHSDERETGSLRCHLFASVQPCYVGG